MRASLRLCSAVQLRKPSIHFLGKHTPSRSSFLPVRGISNRSQPPLTSHTTSQNDSDASPTPSMRSSQNGQPQHFPNASKHQPGYYVSRLQRASVPHRPIMLAHVLAASMHPPPEPPPPYKPLSSLRPWERAWSGPQWYTPRPPIRPRRKRSKTAMVTSLPKSKLLSNDDLDPEQPPIQEELTREQRKVVALQLEGRRRVERIVNFGRRLHSTRKD